MCIALAYVRFTAESDIKRDIWECPLRAKSGLMHRRNCIQPQVQLVSVGVEGVPSTRYFPLVERHLVVGRWMRCIQCLKILRSKR